MRRVLLLGKYRLPLLRAVHPFVDGGPSFRTVTGTLASWVSRRRHGHSVPIQPAPHLSRGEIHSLGSRPARRRAALRAPK